MSAITLETFGSADLKLGYIGWSPVPLTVSGSRASGSKSVTLKSRSLHGSISRVVFMARAGEEPADEITIDLGAADRAVVFVAGKFQEDAKHKGASEDSKDVLVEAWWAEQPAQAAGAIELMIRVRKNANALSDKARKDFIDALATLNGIHTGPGPAASSGKGIYVTDFVGMHVEGSYLNQHGDSMFLPWHRLYLLDLERQLQQVNAAVTLPYWRFDQPAPNLFTEDFMGATESIPDTTPFTPGTSDRYAKFAGTNPLSQWKIGTNNDIQRAAYFDPLNEAAKGRPAFPALNMRAFRMIDQLATLNLGRTGKLGAWVPGTEAGSTVSTEFTRMEGAPHGAAHVSFNGFINDPPGAPRDPLFFLLHCNVDRLWGLWQFLYKRDTASEPDTYPYQSAADIADLWKLIDAPQWPWYHSQSAGDGGEAVPIWPPGTRSNNFTSSPTGKQIAADVPALVDAIDAFGLHAPVNDLGMYYDDVRFDYERFPASPLA